MNLSKYITILGGEYESTWIVTNALKKHFCIKCIIVEDKPSSFMMLKRRAVKLGWRRVAGQILFIIFSNLLRFESRRRTSEIKKKYALDDNPSADIPIIRVKSANDESTIQTIKEINPAVVVVNGTRILSTKLLNSVGATLINMHAGITPAYRGVHGGYWALANKDKEHCGVTVHLVDQGIDTGDILYQQRIFPSVEDNFATYPLLQVAEGIPLMERAVADALSGQLKTQASSLPSHVYYHPTLLEYLKHRVRKGVK